jgi:hypothetical protein
MKTLRSLSLIIISILFSLQLMGQSKYGNEWIDHTKTYYKLKVAKTGIYRVTYDQLSKVGFPSSVKSSDLKLISLGKERPLYINSNTTFGNGDFIEFYGEHHTIGVDTFLYQNWTNELFNPKYSLCTDTTTYFLTISPNTNNLRMTTASPNYDNNTLPPSPFCIYEEILVKNNSFYKIKDGEIQQSIYESSEGFGDNVVGESLHKISVSGLKTSNIRPQLKIRYGQGVFNSILNLVWNDREIDKINAPGKINIQKTYNLDNGDIVSNNSLFLKNLASSNDRHRVAFISLTYSRNFEFGSQNAVTFVMPAATAGRYIEMKKDKTTGFAYDINRNIRYPMRVNGDQQKLIISGATTAITYYVPESYDTIPSITIFQPKDWNDAQSEFIIITDLILQGATGAIDQYAAHRSSLVGGGYKTKIVSIHDLYDEFAYGATFHPVSLKNFAAWVDEKWSSAKMIMVIGKGVEYTNMRRPNDIINNYRKFFFVPTFGAPGSDVLAFSKANEHFSRIPVGRLAAKSDVEVLDYLDKLKSYDAAFNLPRTSVDRLWMKKVLHLGGGKTESEQNSIKASLDGFAKIISDTIFGGSISSYYKNSFAIIQTQINKEINDKFNEGISILNFFGHSSPSTWDFSLQNPRDFTNRDRYPFITSFGCYSGNLFSPSTSGISETYVLQPQKAGIAFYASTGTAFIGSLAEYGKKFYKAAFTTNKDNTIGEIINIIAKNNIIPYTNPTELALYTQLTFHGDPALRFFIDDTPDYTFDYTSIKRTSSSIGNENRFNFELDIANIGAFTNDSINVYFYYQLPSGKSSDTIKLRIKPTSSIHRVAFTLPNPGIEATGRNVLYGKIDYDDKINEINETNNFIAAPNGSDGFEFYISGNLARPVYPPNYGIINTPEHYSLKASTASVPVQTQIFKIQIDTTKYFNSPLLETKLIESIGGLMEHKPGLPLRSNMVYYWRISPDSTANQGFQWQNASFVYLPNEEEGWNQSHYFQFTEDKLQDFELSENTNRKFEFEFDQYQLKIRNKIYNSSDLPFYNRNNVNLNSVKRAWDYTGAGLIFNYFDHKTGEVFNPPSGLFGSIPPGGSDPTSAIAFSTKTPEDRKKIIDFIRLANQKQRSLVVLSAISKENEDMAIADWENDKAIFGTTLFEVFEEMGATYFKEFKTLGTVPYIFASKLGSGNKFEVIEEKIGLAKSDIVESEIFLDVIYRKKASLISTVIGPSTKWGNLKFKINEINSSDLSSIDVFGIDNQGQEDKLLQKLTENTSLENIDAANYKYLKLIHTFSDSSTATPTQLDYWRISNAGLSDLAIKVSPDDLPSKLSVNQGEPIEIKYNVVNIGSTNFDSILVKYSIVGENNTSKTSFKRLAPLATGNTISDIIKWETNLGIGGKVKLIVDVNPNLEQDEIYSFNNMYVLDLEIKGDKLNPNLQVYFDGIQILDGDIVSPKPEIKITLRDDNSILPITSASNFTIQLDTAYNLTMDVPTNGPNIRFVPANAQNGTATLTYTPFLKDGDYTLRVQGKDMSGNISGTQPKTVNFRVVTENAVSQVLNYPNPFSNSTQFIFTLTGEDLPDQVSITIMTLSGKVVKEITKEQLGPLKIGLNRTSYKWDGTDEFGDKLANGVYLYKVNILSANGEQYKKRQEGKIDSFFEKNIGKLVIMR